MTIRVKTLGLGCLFGASLLAQHVGVLQTQPSPLASPNAFTYGNILFPGGVPSNHVTRLGATVNGTLPMTGAPGPGYPMGPGYSRGGNRGRTVIVPYGVPVYYPGDYGYGYGYQQQPATNVTVVIPQQPTPTVVINQNYVPETAHPVMRDSDNEEVRPSSGVKVYGGKPRRTSDDEPAAVPAPARAARTSGDDPATIFLIALKDSSVHSAIGYWVEEGTLHYVTPQGAVNRVSMAMVDKALSEQLNSERKVDFSLKN
ncbi:MAG TPA: hypothetical protein VMZ52_12310 [Bryobacteraceae bacterium]|nr:hypothetical protein [Bryobacteraceae bacterium]